MNRSGLFKDMLKGRQTEGEINKKQRCFIVRTCFQRSTYKPFFMGLNTKIQQRIQRRKRTD